MPPPASRQDTITAKQTKKQENHKQKASFSWLTPAKVFTGSILLRLVLLLYGSYQDAHSALKYTDIDYYVFTDAARFLSRNRSPYDRATYRYTPLLAWLLLPTTLPGAYWFSFGKALFAASDVVAGWLIVAVLKRRGLSEKTALKYACVWLLNPMVANISTRGSSEGLLCVMVMGLLWAIETRRTAVAGALLGLAVHFKIYPFIYGVSMLLALETDYPPSAPKPTTLPDRLLAFFNRDRLILLGASLATFTTLNNIMYLAYGLPFLQHTYLYHLTRTDHRHNFSPYNALLYLSSSPNRTSLNLSTLAFLPQLALSTLLIPFATATTNLPATLLAQTLAFVAFNKVATSQYFLWYLVFLPVYLPGSVFVRRPRLGLVGLAAWIGAQALWLSQGYALEMLGRSAWMGLWGASLVFLGVNCWILGLVVEDVVVGQAGGGQREEDAIAAAGRFMGKVKERARETRTVTIEELKTKKGGLDLEELTAKKKRT